MDDIIGAESKWTIQEVVKACSISRPTVQKALKSGELQGVQSQKTKMVHRSRDSEDMGKDEEKKAGLECQTCPCGCPD